MQKEIWKDIPNYEGLYQVSNLGRVKSLKRIVYNNSTNNILYTQKELIKKQKIKSVLHIRRYYIVSLFKNSLGKDYSVHQLVAMAFLGHVPCGMKMVIDHIDNDSLNNKLENLQIVTVRENCSKDKKNKTSKYIGASWCKQANKWMSSIRINKKQTYLGYFNCEFKAHLVYQNKLKEILK
jgi:hypothetical protein